MVVRRIVVSGVVVALASVRCAAGPGHASTPAADVRLSNDAPGTSGYVSNYTAVTGQPYTDATLTECSRARGRQNEPSVAVNPRNPQVIVGSSNDYCGTYNDGADADGAPLPVGPIWLGYYRSQNGGASFQSSLVPGYPGDTSPYAARAQVRTASAGDPVLAWDGDGRLFAGSESSDDPAGSKKTFGDVWVATYENPQGVGGATINDGKEFRRSVIVNRGSSAPNLLGVFNDKTSIAADRTSNPATRGNVYFAWSRFTGNGGSNIYVVRSTDHGATFSKPKLLTTSENDIQDPDIAIRGDGTVTVTWISASKKSPLDSVNYSVSTNGGATWSPSRTLTTLTSYDAQDVVRPDRGGADLRAGLRGRRGRGGGTPATPATAACWTSACESGYIFFRRTTSPRSSADQTAPGNPWVYLVVDPVVPGSQVPTGTTYGATEVGRRRPERRLRDPVQPADRSQERPGPDRPGGDRAPAVRRRGRRLRCRARHVVGQPERPVLLADPPGRQLRERHVGPVPRRLRHHPRSHHAGPRHDHQSHRRHQQPELGPVRRPHRALRRRLPVDRLGRRPDLLDLDRLPQHGARQRPTDRGHPR